MTEEERRWKEVDGICRVQRRTRREQDEKILKEIAWPAERRRAMLGLWKRPHGLEGGREKNGKIMEEAV